MYVWLASNLWLSSCLSPCYFSLWDWVLVALIGFELDDSPTSQIAGTTGVHQHAQPAFWLLLNWVFGHFVIEKTLISRIYKEPNSTTKRLQLYTTSLPLGWLCSKQQKNNVNDDVKLQSLVHLCTADRDVVTVEKFGGSSKIKYRLIIQPSNYTVGISFFFFFLEFQKNWKHIFKQKNL